MKFLIISGAPDTGKTTSINLLAYYLCFIKYSTGSSLSNIINYQDINNPTFNLPTFQRNHKGKYDDVSVVVMINGRKIIIHSATDDTVCINNLERVICNHQDAEVVITTCRDIDYPYMERSMMYDHIINPNQSYVLEVPRGKLSRKKTSNIVYANRWNENETLNLLKFISSNCPYNL